MALCAVIRGHLELMNKKLRRSTRALPASLATFAFSPVNSIVASVVTGLAVPPPSLGESINTNGTVADAALAFDGLPVF